jgi:hypothetical protein
VLERSHKLERENAILKGKRPDTSIGTRSTQREASTLIEGPLHVREGEQEHAQEHEQEREEEQEQGQVYEHEQQQTQMQGKDEIEGQAREHELQQGEQQEQEWEQDDRYTPSPSASPLSSAICHDGESGTT